MTRKEFFKGIKTWKGAELRCAMAGNKPVTKYEDFTLHTMVNCQTMFVKSAVMAIRHGRPAPHVSLLDR